MRFVILVFLLLFAGCSGPESDPPQESDIVELNGICDWETDPKLCPVDNTQKYLRQHIVDKKSTMRSGLSVTLMNSRRWTGFFIDDVIGLKTEQDDWPGLVGKAYDISQINREVTFYEVTGIDLDAKYKRAMGIKRAKKTHTLFPGCRVEEYRRQHKTGKYKEKVVVLHRSTDLNEEDVEICSARGHLYFLDIPDNIHQMFYSSRGLFQGGDLILHWQAIAAYLKPENRYIFEPVINAPVGSTIEQENCMSLRVNDYEIMSVIEQSKYSSQNEFDYTFVAPTCVFKGEINYWGETLPFEYFPTGFIKLNESAKICHKCTILPDWLKIKKKPANLHNIWVDVLASGEFRYGNMIGTQDQVVDKIEQDYKNGIYTINLSLDESQKSEELNIRSRFKERGIQDVDVLLVQIQ